MGRTDTSPSKPGHDARRYTIRHIWKLAWPIILSNITVPLLGLVDEQPDLVTSGLSQLQTRASQAHEARFEQLDEADRVVLLTEIETTPFFKAVRSSLMFGLYDNKTLFPLFGYEGSSWEKGGYVNRGFDDIDWL